VTSIYGHVCMQVWHYVRVYMLEALLDVYGHHMDRHWNNLVTRGFDEAQEKVLLLMSIFKLENLCLFSFHQHSLSSSDDTAVYLFSFGESVPHPPSSFTFSEMID